MRCLEKFSQSIQPQSWLIGYPEKSGTIIFSTDSGTAVSAHLYALGQIRQDCQYWAMLESVL